MPIVRKIIKKIIPSFILKEYRIIGFDESQIIYRGRAYKNFLQEAVAAARPNVCGKAKQTLLKDIKKVCLTDGTRPDEYLLYNYDSKDKKERDQYMPQRLKDTLLCDYYGDETATVIGEMRDKYSFYKLVKPYFKREVTKVESENDRGAFNVFCKKHPRFICKIINGGCGVGVRVEEVQNEKQINGLFKELIQQGGWIIEELIQQDPFISAFNSSSVNTVRFPSFKHGNKIVQKFPCIRFGRQGSIVDNAGQGGVFASIDIETGTIITNGFDELGHEYECHPDSKIRFNGFAIPRWNELLEEAKQAHMSLSEKQVYVAFDFALSAKGWVIVEANWGDFVLQQTALKRGLKKEFIQMLKGYE